MSDSDVRVIRPAPSVVRAAVTAISVLLLLTALGIVLFVMMRTPLKDDIAWLLYVAHRWLAGRELYVDVVEVNPPLIVWISAIPIQLGRVLGIDGQYTAMPFFIAIVLGCAWWTASLLQGAGKLFEDRIPVFAAIGTVLLVVPAGDLGQREHLLVAAILPYLALFARSLDGNRPALRDAVLAGILAGLGCALKPRYAGVFVVLEGLALLRGLPLFRAKSLAAGATLLAYAILVAIFCPAYLRRAVPLALALYAATDVSLWQQFIDTTRLLFGEAVALVLWWSRRRRMPESNLMLTLVVFAITSTVICFIDGKDWFYHRLPATIATILALICWASSAMTHRLPTERGSYLRAGTGRHCLRGVPGRCIPTPRAAGRPCDGAAAGHHSQAREDHPQAQGTDLHRLLRMDRVGLSRRQQHRRRLGVALRFDVGIEGRTLARPVRPGRGQGMADTALGCAGLHRGVSRHRRGRYAGRRAKLCWYTQQLRSGVRACLVALSTDRSFRRLGRLSPYGRRLFRPAHGGRRAASRIVTPPPRRPRHRALQQPHGQPKRSVLPPAPAPPSGRAVALPVSWLSMHMPQPFTAETASDHSSNVALSTPGRAMTFIRSRRACWGSRRRPGA